MIDGEYTPRELSGTLEVIGWIVEQPWSSGAVGMMGISWGGLNALQVAALKHPALKAVISLASTVDRCNNDIHYKNGCHLSAQLSWAATMLAYQSRPPDPVIVGDRWRSMWLERLENEPFMLEEWLAHQRRDGFWKHGSICEDFDGFPVPVLVIAGWADGYRNTPLLAVEGLGDRAKAMIGPWVHKYPHIAWPKPRADFHAEAIAWWNRWLRDEQNGAEMAPQVRAFILDGPKPALRRTVEPGFWISKHVWREPDVQNFHVDAHGILTESVLDIPGVQSERFLRPPLDTGTSSGEWFTLKPDAEMAGDQKRDDAGSLTFETEPFIEPTDYLDQPELGITLAAHAPAANLIARIIDVHPDGSATRVTFGVLNLAHRDGNEAPRPMTPGVKTAIRLTLDACGYRIGVGHRLRLSLSTAYWPMVLPPPEDLGWTTDLPNIVLAMPLLGEHQRIVVPEPEDPDLLPRHIERSPAATERRVEKDLMTGTTRYILREETWSITADDPLTMTGASSWTCIVAREDWSVRTDCTARLTCTHDDWPTSAEVKAYEGEAQVFEKHFQR